jgi:integrase
MALTLTDTRVRSLKAPEGRRLEVFDPREPGLLLRVSPGGRRTWYFRYRSPKGRQPRLKLGTYPATGIKDAQELARAARATLERGIDPAEKERKRREEVKAIKVRTFDDLMRAYFDACEKGTYMPRGKKKKAATLTAERALYDRHVKKELGRRAFDEVGRKEIKSLTRGMLERGITTQANHAFALVRQALSYAVDEEELLENNVAKSMKAPVKKRVRERTLSDNELKAVWTALETPSEVDGANGRRLAVSKGVSLALRLAAILLQRRAEIATMAVSDVDLDQATWIVPSDRAKNGRAHVVPLPPMALKLIKDALAARPNPDSPFVFPSPRSRGQKSVHPDALTRAMAHLSKALDIPLTGPHDLRRTGTTVMSSERLREVSPFVVSQVLNHITDAGGGSATTRRHYNVHDYASEKRAALVAWERLLMEIVGIGSEPANVIALKQGAA